MTKYITILFFSFFFFHTVSAIEVLEFSQDEFTGSSQVNTSFNRVQQYTTSAEQVNIKKIGIRVASGTGNFQAYIKSSYNGSFLASSEILNYSGAGSEFIYLNFTNSFTVTPLTSYYLQFACISDCIGTDLNFSNANPYSLNTSYTLSLPSDYTETSALDQTFRVYSESTPPPPPTVLESVSSSTTGFVSDIAEIIFNCVMITFAMVGALIGLGLLISYFPKWFGMGGL